MRIKFVVEAIKRDGDVRCVEMSSGDGDFRFVAPKNFFEGKYWLFDVPNEDQRNLNSR